MANNTLTAITNVLMKKEEYIGSQIVLPAKQKLMTLINRIKMEKKSGQDLKKYVKVKIRPSGGWALTTEGGDYPGAQAQSSIEGYFAPVLVTHTYGITTHSLAAFENQPARRVGEQLGEDIDQFIEMIQHRKKMMFTGRKGMVLARATAAGTSSTFTSTTDVPVRAVVGDYVVAFKDASGTGDERGFATSDTGTSYLGTTALYVGDVDYDARTIALTNSGGTAATGKWTAAAVLTEYGHNSTNMTGPTGLEDMLDTVNDTGFKWDADDSATYDHNDTIYNLARASYTQLNCGTLSQTGYLTLDKLQRAVAKCVAKGASVGDLSFVSAPKQFEYLTQTNFSRVGEWRRMVMGGQEEEVFCVTGLGQGTIPWVCDYGVKNGVVLVIDRSKLVGVELPGGWDKTGTDIWHQQTAASGAGYAAAKLAYWNFWVNWGLVFPNTSLVMYGLTQ